MKMNLSTMFNPEQEEYILDFKAEERKPHMTVFEVEDITSNSSTISASEVNSIACITPTPALFCTLKKPRVMIKKLPQDILAKYKLDKPSTPLGPPPRPARASRRVEGKQIPGLYLSLHVNKPLTQIINKKKRNPPTLLKPLIQKNATESRTKLSKKKQTMYYQNLKNSVKSRLRAANVSIKSLKTANLPAKSYNNTSQLKVLKNDTKVERSLSNRQKCGQSDKSKEIKKGKLKTTTSPDSVGPSNSANQVSLLTSSSSHERIASSKLIDSDRRANNFATSTLPNCPDVVITKYDMPSQNLVGTCSSPAIPLRNSINPIVVNEPLDISSDAVAASSSVGNNYIQHPIIVSRPQHNVNVQVPLTLGQTFSNYSLFQNNQPSNPTLNYSTLLNNQCNQLNAFSALNYSPLQNNQISHPTLNYSPLNSNQSNQSNALPTLNYSPLQNNHLSNSTLNYSPLHSNQSNQTNVFSTLNKYPLQNKQSNNSNAFPKLIGPLPPNDQITCLQPNPINSSQRTITLQTITLPQNVSVQKDVDVVPTPKVLIINRPPVEPDPLDMSRYLASTNSTENLQANKENTDSFLEPFCESETDVEPSDTEQQTEPEVIKRIIYHTKAVQTKFTCNSSICGLVDSEGFNLNCFYCYDIFPLHKWPEFKEHIKRIHHVEENANQSETEEDIGGSNYQNTCPPKSSPKLIDNKNITLNKENLLTKSLNTTEQVLKKLPLEPRLVAQRFNKTIAEPNKTTPSPSKQIRKSQYSANLSGKQLSVGNLNNSSCVSEVINLDSDEEIDLTRESKKTNQKSLLKNRATPTDKVITSLPSLPHITIKKIEHPSSLNPINSLQRPAESSYNKNVQQIIKTFPKPTTPQILANGRTRPRFFVVKKVIKVPTTEQLPNINPSKDMIPSQISEPEKVNSSTNTNTADKDEDEDMPSSDEIEDSEPKPTNGRGIVFGVTNTMVVIEFLLKLKTFPELWRSQLKNNTSNNYKGGINKMCSHLNNRFELKITDAEMRLSIQRVKNWYCRMLKNIHKNNINPNNTEPYKHKFPLYFRILKQYLTTDIDYASDMSLGSRFRTDQVPIVEQVKPKLDITAHFKVPKPATTPAKTPPVKANTKTTDAIADTLIEFDADTVYGHESSDEGVVDEFDKYVVAPKKRRSRALVGKFQCDVCQKYYRRIYELKKHRVMHFPPEFECGLCSQKFYFQRWAEKCAHLKKKICRKETTKTPNETPSEQNDSVEKETLKPPKRVWPKKIFKFKMICEICGASYRSIGALNTHKRDKHYNQREKCVVCKFTALSKWRIVQHQKKRHIVEPGTVEEVAKKTRARTLTKTRFSNEAMQEFLWRREMRKKLKPGETFHGCCKCRIDFKSRREKILHNKLEHPIRETTVVCLLCLPNKLLLSNSNCARRHYTDIHKIPWHEIDDLVKRTKPIYSFLNKEQYELLNSSENYKELLEEFLKDIQMVPGEKIEILEDETLKAVQNLPSLPIAKELDKEVNVECATEENVYVDCIIDHDYNCEEVFTEHEYVTDVETTEKYTKEQHETNEYYDDNDAVSNESRTELHSNQSYDDGIVALNYDIENKDTNNKLYNNVENEQEYLQSIVDDFIEGELVEESIVIEECVDGEGEEYF